MGLCFFWRVSVVFFGARRNAPPKRFAGFFGVAAILFFFGGGEGRGSVGGVDAPFEYLPLYSRS